ncbi:MAG: PEP-CTERM sorting domain-containing protein [Akkermansiaceae bacterium]
MDQLYTRSGNQFAGAAIWGIETVPEPSSTLMLGLGGALALIRRRRK